MSNNPPLLSICIPTYNRADYLKGALENITSDPAFDNSVEIVISDNASTDNTYEVVHEYCSKYDNILYFRNIENVRDINFFLALSRANGKYVRLFNDTLRFSEGKLQRMLEIISQADDSKGLFLFNDSAHTIVQNKCVKTTNINSFLNHVSYNITWIANFGCWKSDLMLFDNPERYSSLQLSQVDWFLHLTSQRSSVYVYFDGWFNSIPPLHKGGYNLFKVFVDNYLLILKRYRVSFVVFEIEKYRLFRYFVLSWLLRIHYDTNNRFTFITNDKWWILLKHYWGCPYFYIGIFYYKFKTLFFTK